MWVDIAVARAGKPIALGGEWVRPFAHAFNGGLRVDVNGWTGVPGLFACGEAAGGMHGADRIGGNMLTATQVFGARAGAEAARTAREARAEGTATPPLLFDPTGGWDQHQLLELREDLESKLEAQGLILRTAAGMRQALERCEAVVRELDRPPKDWGALRAFIQVRTVARFGVRFFTQALARSQSSGPHYVVA
jgi:succinate dehydrogenase/fumarate reductase flavoprotein subunit